MEIHSLHGSSWSWDHAQCVLLKSIREALAEGPHPQNKYVYHSVLCRTKQTYFWSSDTSILPLQWCTHRTTEAAPSETNQGWKYTKFLRKSRKKTSKWSLSGARSRQPYYKDCAYRRSYSKGEQWRHSKKAHSQPPTHFRKCRTDGTSWTASHKTIYLTRKEEYMDVDSVTKLTSLLDTLTKEIEDDPSKIDVVSARIEKLKKTQEKRRLPHQKRRRAPAKIPPSKVRGWTESGKQICLRFDQPGHKIKDCRVKLSKLGDKHN